MTKKQLLPLALVLSLALNVVFIGYGVSHGLRHGEKSRQHVMRERMEGLLTLVPPEIRTTLRQDLDAQSTTVSNNMKLIRNERRHIEKLVRAKDLTADELQQSFARLRELHSETQKIYQDAFSKAVAGMSVEQRTRTHDAIHERHKMLPIKKPVSE